MNSFFEMDWNAKCDWENLVVFGSKVGESSAKLQPMDWGIEEEGELIAGSFNLSAWVGGSGGSGSDMQHASSAKSSISASTDSSSREGLKTSNFGFEAFEGFLGDFNKKESASVELTGSSSPMDGSIGSVEPLIGLKLGKRTYFENNCSAGSVKNSSLSAIPILPATTAKKIRSPCQSSLIARCQVEGCNLDLSSAKDYHRKHRVCESHSKNPKVIIGGLERRFCQQCSRFHGLSEFDAKKRSCRRRLSDHNARRRKPQQETIQFSSARLPSSFYDGRQQLNFLSSTPNPRSRVSGDLIWETCNSKFTLTKGYSLKHEKADVIDQQPHLTGFQLPFAASTHDHGANTLMSSMGPAADSSNQGFKETMLSFNSDAALDFRRALSLLSSNSYSSCEPESVTRDNQLRVTHENLPSALIDLVPQGLPLPTSELWQAGQHLNNHMHNSLSATSIGAQNTSSATSIGVQEIQLLKLPYEVDFNKKPLR